MKKFLQIPVLVVLAVVSFTAARAQRVEQIVENPDAVRLQELWRVQGGGEHRVGYGVGGIGDLNADGADEWCIYYGSLGEWQVYYGSRGDLPTSPSWRFLGSPSLTHAVIGDFYGNGEKLIGFNRDVKVEFHWELQVHFFRAEAGVLEDAPRLLYDPHVMYIKDVQAADLDGDGDDELIVSRTSDYPEVWIYEGGPDFQVQTPTHVIRDADSIGGGGQYFLRIAQLERSTRLSLITSGTFRSDTGQVQKINLYLGSGSSPWTWNSPDVSWYTTDESITPDWFKLDVYDVNGDGIDDFYGNVYTGSAEKIGSYLWLSSEGRDIRTRRHDSTDWDIHYVDYYIFDQQIGPLGDSTGRWRMLNVGPAQDARLYALNAGAEGPNRTWDAYAGDSRESMFNIGVPAGDVNGDGWADVIFGNFNYRSRGGIAVIFAGGPYIPNDDTTTGVVEYGVAGESGGLYVWPNPVVDELHLAWRGNLKRMPARFAVYDLLGRVVGERDVDTWSGAALWNCPDLPAGACLLTLFDPKGSAIATARVLKQ